MHETERELALRATHAILLCSSPLSAARSKSSCILLCESRGRTVAQAWATAKSVLQPKSVPVLFSVEQSLFSDSDCKREQSLASTTLDHPYVNVSVIRALGDEMELSHKAHIVLAGPDADPCVESGDVHTSTIYETR